MRTFALVTLVALGSWSCGARTDQECSGEDCAGAGGESPGEPGAGGADGAESPLQPPTPTPQPTIDISAPPPAPTGPAPQEATVTMSAFTLGPGEEAFMCQNFPNPFNGNDVDVMESEHSMAEGSHHLFVFHADGPGSGGPVPCSGLEYGRYVHSSQRSHQVLSYPEGVARHLPGRTGLRIQVHYLNTTPEPIEASVTVTLRRAEPGAVREQAGQLFFNTMDIHVDPQSAGSTTKTCSVPPGTKLLRAASHMHRAGVHFEAHTADGRLVYETDECAEPEVREYDPPFEVSPATSIKYRCEYENPNDFALTFGESAETHEMCIFSADYYPAPNGENIDCLF